MTDSPLSRAPVPYAMGQSLLFRVYVIFICTLIAVLEGFDIQALGIVAPILMPLLSLDQIQAGEIFSAGQAGLVLGSLIGGFMCYRVGRRNVLLISVIIFGIFTWGTAYVFDYKSLIFSRIGTGLGLGAAMPALIGIALDVATPKNRVKTVSIIMAGMPLGGAVVSIFAALYLKKLGWTSLFQVGGILPLCLIPLTLILPNIKPLKLDKSPPIKPLNLLFGQGRGLTTLLLWLTFMLSFSVVYTMLNWLPTLMKLRGFSPETGQVSSLVFNLVSVIGIVLIGGLVDRFGSKTVLPTCYLGLMVAVFGMAFLTDITPLLISFGSIGFCLFGSQYALSGLSPHVYPTAGRDIGTGVAIAFGRIGSILGPLLAGYVLKLNLGPSSVPLALIPIIVVAGLAITILTRTAKLFET